MPERSGRDVADKDPLDFENALPLVLCPDFGVLRLVDPVFLAYALLRVYRFLSVEPPLGWRAPKMEAYAVSISATPQKCLLPLTEKKRYIGPLSALSLNALFKRRLPSTVDDQISCLSDF